MALDSFAAFEDDEEGPKTRELMIQDRKWTAVAIAPHGFWRVQPEKGPVPKFLNGAYTSIFELEKDINRYLNGKHTS